MTLSVKRVVNVTIVTSPMAAQRRGFGTLCILGDSDALGSDEHFRSYTGIEQVTEDFGADAPETLCATAYYSQSPKPTSLMIARWNNQPSAGYLQGGTIGKDISALTAVSDGSFKVTFDGSDEVSATSLDFTSAESLQDIADIITAALGENGKASVKQKAIVITSASVGTISQVSVASAADSGTDVSALLKLTEVTGAKATAGKQITETVNEAVSRILTDFGRSFYGLTLAVKAEVSDNDYLEIAQSIEAASASHIFGITLTDPDLPDTSYLDEGNDDIGDSDADLASKLKSGKHERTFMAYATYVEGDSAYRLNPYLAASIMGRAFTVDFTGSNTTITLKFKQAPSIQPTDLTETQATNLEQRNINVYAIYENDTYIIEQGVMASGTFIDERHGLDWLQNAIETEIYNALYQSQTKIGQIDDDMNLLVAADEKALIQAKNNKLIGPGVWNSDGFGDLKAGDTLPNGYYIYNQSVNEQSQSDREARKGTLIQNAIKLVGAVHSQDVQVNVNR